MKLQQLNVGPDGVVRYVESRMNFDDDRYDTRIVSGSGDTVTEGPRDTLPKQSPVDQRIAFLQKPDDDSPDQVVLLADSGPVAVTAFPLGVRSFNWSPDGSRLVVAAGHWNPDLADLTDDERERRPRRIIGVPFRHDIDRWTCDRRFQLWLVDPGGEQAPRRITGGDYDESLPVWSPDGSRVAFVTDRSEEPVRGLARQICEVNVATGEVSDRGVAGGWQSATYRPDGVLHAIGHPRFEDWPTNFGLYRWEEHWTPVAPELDRNIPAAFYEPAWDETTALFPVEDGGSTRLIALAPDGSYGFRTVAGEVHTAVAFDGATITMLASSSADPGYLRTISTDGATSTFGHSDVPFETQPGEHLSVVSEEVDIDAWVYLPGGDESVPLLLNIHGGPAAQYGVGFNDEFQVYADAGYGVVACNPRGSSGRGNEFLQSVTRDGWGVVDLADVTAVVDAALERFPRLDADRMGIMGGSYGGFLTAWVTARDHRFKSAVVERALLSWPSFFGTSDIGMDFPAMYTGYDMPESPGELWEMSPLAKAQDISTPTLVVHSEGDYRCPIEQAEQLFMILLRAGTPSEFVRFPGESHELSRSGSPLHRRERFEAILDWHERYLK